MTLSIGEALVQQLEARGVEVVFGIPGVHTVELYRGLGASKIRHITPRHEQGAGFMADGYARVSGKPGVCFLITGPGLTNAITPMAQALADSIPMLVITGVNKRTSLGKGRGHLHELPDQQGLAATVALASIQVREASELAPALDRAFAILEGERGGPVHIEIPTDVMPLPAEPAALPESPHTAPVLPDVSAIAGRLKAAMRPVILVGGGAKRAGAIVRAIAERLDAPVIQTANARGLMHGHPLTIPCSPSLEAARTEIDGADCILALGTELGPTDYDMNQNGWTIPFEKVLRVDVSLDQLTRYQIAESIEGRVETVAPALLDALGNGTAEHHGADRAERVRKAALVEIGADMRTQLALLDALREALPGALMVGDSTQATYAGNLYYDHDRPCGWFNAATGFGALGFSIPAAIGAALAESAAPVVCIAGDGGAQFTLPEIMAAVDEKLPILFIIWNNHGYGEIASWMRRADITVVGCDPTPPDFEHLAAAYALPYARCAMTPGALREALAAVEERAGPAMIEIAM